MESANVELKYKTTKEGLFIKEWDLQYNVAKFYGLDKAYRYLKSTENRRISILKTKISLSSLIRLEELGLLEIKDGLVFLNDSYHLNFLQRQAKMLLFILVSLFLLYLS